MGPVGGAKTYETVVVYHPDMGEVGVGAATDLVKSIIASNGGSETAVEQWGVRELAYPIRKQTRGFYQVFRYTGVGETVRELERSLRLNDRVLRVISARRGEGSPEASQGREVSAGVRHDGAATAAPRGDAESTE